MINSWEDALRVEQMARHINYITSGAIIQRWYQQKKLAVSSICFTLMAFAPVAVRFGMSTDVLADCATAAVDSLSKPTLSSATHPLQTGVGVATFGFDKFVAEINKKEKASIVLPTDTVRQHVATSLPWLQAWHCQVLH